MKLIGTMKRMLGPLVVTGATMFTTGVMAAVDHVPTISPEWHMEIKTVAAVGAVVISGTWWLSKMLMRIHSRLDSMESRLEQLPCKANDECTTRKRR